MRSGGEPSDAFAQSARFVTLTESPWDAFARISRERAHRLAKGPTLSATPSKPVWQQPPRARSDAEEAKPAASAAAGPKDPTTSGTASSDSAVAVDIWDPAWATAADVPEFDGFLHSLRWTQTADGGLHYKTVENGLVVSREFCTEGDWAKASCPHCRKAYWKDSAQPANLCGTCAKSVDLTEVHRQREAQRRHAFLMGSRCSAECAVSQLPVDVMRHIGEMVH